MVASAFQPAADRILIGLRDDGILGLGSTESVNMDAISWLRYGYSEADTATAIKMGFNVIHAHSLTRTLELSITRIVPVDVLIMERDGTPPEWMRIVALERHAREDADDAELARQI